MPICLFRALRLPVSTDRPTLTSLDLPPTLTPFIFNHLRIPPYLHSLSHCPITYLLLKTGIWRIKKVKWEETIFHSRKNEFPRLANRHFTNRPISLPETFAKNRLPLFGNSRIPFPVAEIATPTPMRTANHSYHNTCILKDCLNLDAKAGDKFIEECKDRYTADECGNIRTIDGRKVIGGNISYRLA